MTYIDVFNAPMFKELNKAFVGFDEHFNRLSKLHSDVSKAANYPPYNIRKLSEVDYVVEIAAAGFNEKDFEITVERDMLIVTGKALDEAVEEKFVEFLHRGIAKRAFTRTFALDEYIEVKSASFVNGILSVYLEKIIPEHKQPKKIAITGPIDKSKLLE